jgi:uncharacterized membrane protein YebE (DUF533 family)
MKDFKKHQSRGPMDTSMYYMWRAVIALAHADGLVQEAEREYITRITGNMARVYELTQDQVAGWKKGLDTPESINDLLRYINDPQYRSQLIYFGARLAWSDGTLAPSEDAILKKLRADQMASLDMEQIRKDVAAAVADEMFAHDLKMSALRPQTGLSGMLDDILLRTGVDLMDL